MQIQTMTWPRRGLYALAILLLCLATMGPGGCRPVLNQRVQTELHDGKQKLNELADEFKSIKAEALKVKTDIQALNESLARKEISLADYQAQFPDLAAKGNEFLTRALQLEREGEQLASKMERLHQDYEVPWWQIGLNGGLTILSMLLGGGYLVRGRGLQRAGEGLQVLVSAIERGEDQASIKKKVDKANNPAVEAVVAKII